MPGDAPFAHWMPSPNFWQGRYGHTPLYIVCHGTAGQMPGCLDWLTDPRAGASTHYLVATSGIVYQLVSEDDTAWANAPIEPGSRFLGIQSNPNFWTLSIEHERWNGNTTPITPQQQTASARLIADIRSRHGALPLIPHSDICPVNRPDCPGPGFPWAALQSVAVQAPSAVRWATFTAQPQHLPLVFYREASFDRPLYTSAAGLHTVLDFDGWRYGPPVQDSSTHAPDRRWYHRHNPEGQEGWAPSAWVVGNAPGSTP